MDAVSGDQHVGIEGLTAECKCDLAAVLPDIGDFGAEAEPDLRVRVDRIAQDTLQIGAVNEAIGDKMVMPR